MIPCFDSIGADSTLAALKLRFKTEAEGKSEEEQKAIGKRLAIEAHRELYTEVASKKIPGVNISKYEEPGTSLKAKSKINEINKKYDDLLSQVKPIENAKDIRGDQGRGGKKGSPAEGSQDKGGQNIQPPSVSETVPPGTEQQTGSHEENEEPVNISHDALSEAAKRLDVPEPQRGTQKSTEEYIQRGRDLIRAGADPEQVGDEWRKSGMISHDRIAIARVHYGDLERAVDSTAKGSPERAAAEERMIRWRDEVLHPMTTEWGESGKTIQDINRFDESSPTSMKNQFESLAWHSPTEAQEEKIEAVAAKVKKAADETKQAADRMYDSFDKAHLFIEEEPEGPKESKSGSSKSKGKDKAEFAKTAPKPVEVRFAGKKDSKFSAEDARDIWQYARENYIGRGMSFPDVLQKVSSDLGLTYHQVSEAIDSPKSNRKISDEMYRAMKHERDIRKQAQMFLMREATPSLIKTWRKLPGAFFAIKTFAHGTVGPITHAGMNIFVPSARKTYWPNMVKSYVFAFSRNEANYERAMNEFTRQRNYVKWMKAGLAIEPSKGYDDFQYQNAPEWLKWMAATGDRGFNALKLMRYDMAEHYLKNFSDASYGTEKQKGEIAKEVARLVNHATGTITRNLGEVSGAVASTLFFAPKLELSRWARYIVEPAEAAGVLVKMVSGDATEADKVKAKIFIARAAEMFTTYLGALAANYAFNSMMGAKSNVNFKDPTKTDFLQFKLGGANIDVSGGMLSTLHFAAKLATEVTDDSKKMKIPGREVETIGGTMLKYARSKASPIASDAADVLLGTDYRGRPYPWSDKTPPKGTSQYTMQEYLLQQLPPIPISEMVRYFYDKMDESGTDKLTTKEAAKGIMLGVFTGLTGARVYQDTESGSGEDFTPQTQSDSSQPAGQAQTQVPAELH